jgi:hypothetical protein
VQSTGQSDWSRRRSQFIRPCKSGQIDEQRGSGHQDKDGEGDGGGYDGTHFNAIVIYEGSLNKYMSLKSCPKGLRKPQPVRMRISLYPPRNPFDLLLFAVESRSPSTFSVNRPFSVDSHRPLMSRLRWKNTATFVPPYPRSIATCQYRKSTSQTLVCNPGWTMENIAGN